MQTRFDDLTKSVAGSMSRREALCRIGPGLLGLVLAALGLAAPPSAAAGKPAQACGPGSTASCQSLPTGSSCHEEQSGVCKAIKGSTDCYCSFKARRGTHNGGTGRFG
jgi:hypothetical protein